MTNFKSCIGIQEEGLKNGDQFVNWHRCPGGGGATAVDNFETCIGAQGGWGGVAVTNFETCMGTKEDAWGYGDQFHNLHKYQGGVGIR